MADISITELNASMRRVTGKEPEKPFRLNHPFVDKIWGNKDVHGGDGYNWQVNTGETKFIGPYGPNGVMKFGAEELISEYRLDFKHLYLSLTVSGIERKMAQGNKQLWVFDRARNQYETRRDALNNVIGKIMLGAGKQCAAPDGDLWTPPMGLSGIATHDVEYAGHTPVSSTGTKMWCQPYVLDMTATTSPSHGIASLFTSTATFQDLYDATSCFYLPKVADVGIQWIASRGKKCDMILVDRAGWAAWNILAQTHQNIMPGKVGSIGWPSIQYEGVDIVHDFDMDTVCPGKMFAIDSTVFEPHILTGAEGTFNDYAPVTRAHDSWVGDMNLSYTLVCRRRDTVFSCINMPAMAA